jgi:sulfur dioxygenase
VYFHPIEDPDTGQIGYLLADAGYAGRHHDRSAAAQHRTAARAAGRAPFLTLGHVLRTHVHASQPLNCSALSELTGATLVIADGVGINAACPARSSVRYTAARWCSAMKCCACSPRPATPRTA